MNDPIGQLIAPVIAALFVAFLTWRLNRILSAGQPMTPISKKMLTHGFLFVLGIGLLMGWNDQLASLLRFPGREVWRPLGVAWAALLLYDASRSLPKRPSLAERMAQSPVLPDHAVQSIRPKRAIQAYATTALRFILFFAVLGAIGARQLAGYITVVALAAALWLLERGSKRTALPPHGLS